LSSADADIKLEQQTNNFKGSETTTKKEIVASFNAPAKPGVYSLSIKIPGLETLEEMILVVE
jgi:hypothetical protein